MSGFKYVYSRKNDAEILSENSDPMPLKLSAKYFSKRKDIWFSNFPVLYLKLSYPLVLVPIKVVFNKVDTGCHEYFKLIPQERPG